jgi:hypothetical protein
MYMLFLPRRGDLSLGASIVAPQFQHEHNRAITVSRSLWTLCIQMSKSTLCYDRRSVGQSVLVSSTHLRPKIKFLLLSDSCGFVDVWQKDRLIVYNWSSSSSLYNLAMNRVEDTTSNVSSIVVLSFIAVDMCLLCRCLEMAASIPSIIPTFSRDIKYFCSPVSPLLQLRIFCF